VACAIINPLFISEGFIKIFHDFGQLFQGQLKGEMFEFLVKFTKGRVAVTLWLILNRWNLVE
jgi:hypothetical protein